MTSNLVEQLEYVGFDPDGPQGFIEALAITTLAGRDYVLHKAREKVVRYDNRGCPTSIEMRHEKAVFPNQDVMLEGFPFAHTPKPTWETTTPTCGYDLPIKAFEAAGQTRREREFLQRRSDPQKKPTETFKTILSDS
ncbi:MAG TPA: hypothetical protein VJJ82_02905 [Candidatus Nanoarchaeia archaeon]|nr:hypothetical protein [Candidatus Nanoarchaeia archaeon]